MLEGESEKVYIIPPNRIRYLSEITENNKAYDRTVSDQSDAASKAYSLKSSADIITEESTKRYCRSAYQKVWDDLTGENKRILENWENKKDNMQLRNLSSK